MWRIECFNGTIWEHEGLMDIYSALEKFRIDTGLHSMDIKQIINLS